MKHTWKIFPEEEKLILASTNLMRRITSVSKDAVGDMTRDARLSAVMNLFARNRELVHFSVVCFANGGYASTKILTRVALENSLYMRLFNKKPELAKEWFVDPEQFRKDWPVWKTINKLFPSNSSLRENYKVFWGILCNYAHSSFKGWSEIIQGEKIAWLPIFNADYADECIGLVFFVIIHLFKQFINAFEKWIPLTLISEINKLLLRDSTMVRRHFQVVNERGIPI